MVGLNSVKAFNIPVEDMDRASAFYERVFGWSTRSIPGSGGDYHSLQMPSVFGGPDGNGLVAGGLYNRGTNGLGQVFLEVAVGSIEECVENVIASGGRLIRGKKPMLDFALFAVVEDTEGNPIGLWEDLA
jgi:predicted enzyme related to lactoylglutathione lyase